MSDLANADVLYQVQRSQRYFNRLSLFFYDLLLYGVISRFAWGCSIKRLDAHYQAYVSANHLEVGVGTGFLLNRVSFPGARPRLVLMDLNPDCLEKTRQKVIRYQPEVRIQNLLAPTADRLPGLDSIAINYVMHCVPGNFREKGKAFVYLKSLLNENGILFGSSVLSLGVKKNVLARSFMWLMNVIGVFNNAQDAADDLKAVLEQNFRVVKFELVGVTAVFAVQRCASASL